MHVIGATRSLVGASIRAGVRSGRRLTAAAAFSGVRHLPLLRSVITFHHVVSDKPVKCIRYRTKNTHQFQADLEFLCGHYRPISLGELTSALKSDGRAPEGAFHLTFDDGHREVAEVIAPILQRRGIPATFFLCPSWLDNAGLYRGHKAALLMNARDVGDIDSADRACQAVLERHGRPFDGFHSSLIALDRREDEVVLDELAVEMGVDFAEYVRSERPYLTSDQVRALISQGFSIGAHSVDHPHYLKTDRAERMRQTKGSVRWLASRFDMPIRSFAFPYNDDGVSPDEIAALHDSELVEVSFGTSPLKTPVHPGHVQRIGMDDPLLSCKETLCRLASVCRQRQGVEGITAGRGAGS